MKKSLRKVWLTVTVVFAIFIVGLIIAYCVGFSAQFNDIDKFERIEIPPTEISKDSLGNFTIRALDDGDFRILQLTDIHIGAGIATYQKDKWALQTVYDLINFSKPHLVVITGDLVFPNPISISINNRKATINLIEFFERIGINYAVTLGNHDNEKFSIANRQEISELYEKAPNCLFSIEDEGVYGYGNYFVNVLNRDGSLNTSLVMMDSNAYSGVNMLKYDFIHDDQVDWYERKLREVFQEYNNGNKTSSLAFFHIPLNEYRDAYDLYVKGSSEVKYFGGELKENGGIIGAPEARGKLFDKMLEIDSTKGVFVGHDHTNDFSLEYKGIRLTYGKSIDYLAYWKIHKNKTIRGGTLITLNRSGEYYNVDHILYDGMKVIPLGTTNF